jgi:hypothetical protein
LFFFVYNELAFQFTAEVGATTSSVLNTAKRVVVIVACAMVFGLSLSLSLSLSPSLPPSLPPSPLSLSVWNM